MRKWMGLLLAGLTVSAWTSLATAADAHGQLIFLPIGKNTVTVNGQATKIDAPAQIIGDRSMVPVRFISETVGATVGWDSAERKVSIALGGRTVEIWIDKTDARVNGQPATLDVAPQIASDRTMVPLRFVTENLGLTVGWDNALRGVYVVSGHVENVVLIEEYTFGTGTLTAKVGQPLVFINLDKVRHTVDATGGAFGSGTMRTGDAWTFQADRAGSYEIYCDLHEDMTGQIVVQN